MMRVLLVELSRDQRLRGNGEAVQFPAERRNQRGGSGCGIDGIESAATAVECAVEDIVAVYREKPVGTVLD
jgi:L-alanine-DL-glutamate epimerase-like enolase superfamily enzyme